MGYNRRFLTVSSAHSHEILIVISLKLNKSSNSLSQSIAYRLVITLELLFNFKQGRKEIISNNYIVTVGSGFRLKS